MRSNIKVHPNPASQGGTVTISGPKGGTVRVIDPQGQPKKVKLDGDGKAVVDVPGKAGETFVVKGGRAPDITTVDVPIVEMQRRVK